MQFDIHTMDEKAPQFIRSILTIDSLGYDCDYISDRQLAKVRIENGMLVTEGGTRYRALIVPSGTTVDKRLKALLTPLQAYVINGEKPQAMARYAKAEAMKSELHLRAIRRKTTDSSDRTLQKRYVVRPHDGRYHSRCHYQWQGLHQPAFRRKPDTQDEHY